MKLQIINVSTVQLVLSLLLSSAGTEVLHRERAPMESERPTDAEIKTMLTDYIDSDRLGVGVAIGITD